MPVITGIGASWELGDSLTICPEFFQAWGDSPQIMGRVDPRITFRIVKYVELISRLVLFIPSISSRIRVVLVVVAC